jgi:myo-inositol-1(or 4)-monophosphatase
MFSEDLYGKREAQGGGPRGNGPLRAILAAAVRAALAGGAVLRELYGKPHRVTHKGAIDLVTEADVASEEKILAVLAELGGQAGVLAEESAAAYERAPEGAVWIIDPLDGTTNFAHGFPLFAVSIAYAEAGVTQAGVVYLPLQDELFSACLGGGAWLNGAPVRVSDVAALSAALLATGFPYAIAEELEGVLAALRRVLPRCQGVRRPGAAAVDLAYLACGRVDGFWEVNLKPWDTAAGLLLVSEAGGMVSTMHGGPASPYVPELLASNGRIHEEMLAQLRDFSRLVGK